jgi:hypothetical protein
VISLEGAAWSSAATWRGVVERSAAIATERASLGSFLFELPAANSRTRGERGQGDGGRRKRGDSRRRRGGGTGAEDRGTTDTGTATTPTHPEARRDDERDWELGTGGRGEEGARGPAESGAANQPPGMALTEHSVRLNPGELGDPRGTAPERWRVTQWKQMSGPADRLTQKGD